MSVKSSGLKIVSLFRGINKRRSDRLRVVMPAEAAWHGLSGAFACTVRDISKTGARISVGYRADMPDEFDLSIREIGVAVRVRVMWRRSGYIGVLFTGAPRILGA